MAAQASYAAEQYGAGIQQQGLSSIAIQGNNNTVGAPDSGASDILRKLNTTDPRDDKRRIEDTKGGLLKECYRWILAHDDFKRWYNSTEGRLMWIKGDPGKGKTMLVCGIIDYITKHLKETGSGASLAYFFCQATDERINNKEAVLRGLAYLLMKHPGASHREIINKYGDAGPDVFRGVNGWYALQDIMETLLIQPAMLPAYIIIDGLDECINGREELLKLVASLARNNISVLVSSRNWPIIGEFLDQNLRKISLPLELNDMVVGDAVSCYIARKVELLTEMKGLDEGKSLEIKKYLQRNANDTFLWVALVSQELSKVKPYRIIAELKNFPPGLQAFFQREANRLGLESMGEGVFRNMLAVVSLVYRPLDLLELSALVIVPEHEFGGLNDEDIRALWKDNVETCSSFLTLKNDTIYFVHQSAQDFVKTRFVKADDLTGPASSHGDIAERAIASMSGILHEDMYGCKRPETTVEDALKLNNDSLGRIKYACVHWLDHLTDMRSQDADSGMLQSSGIVFNFLGEHTLHWLESLALLRAAPSAIVSLTHLISAMEKRFTKTDQGLLNPKHTAVPWSSRSQNLFRTESSANRSPKRLTSLSTKHEAIRGSYNYCKTLEASSDTMWSA